MNETITPAPETPEAITVPKIGRRYYFLTLITSLIGASLQMILLLSEYDNGIGMYRRSSMLANVFTGFVLLVTIFIFTLPFICRRDLAKARSQTGLVLPSADVSVTFASTLCGFILVAIMILSLWKIPPGPLATAGDYFWLAVILLLLPTALFFFCLALPIKHRPSTETALAFFPIFWCAAYLMSVYFNNTTALNSPVRILTEFATIASMLFFLMELRVRVGKPNPIFLITFINLSVFYSSVCALPLISAAFINQWSLTQDILYSAVQLCFLTYFIARANTLVRSQSK